MGKQTNFFAGIRVPAPILSSGQAARVLAGRDFKLDLNVT